jgi:UDP-glucose 4-epimerase
MRVLVTGAAGFVGSHAVMSLQASGHAVTATDMVERREAWRLPAETPNDRLRYVAGPLASLLPALLQDIDEIWHFAANADIPLGASDTTVDLQNSTLLTHQVLEAMRASDCRRIVFASTSSVYGNGFTRPIRESDGPLRPCSLYAAGKVASEALISAYCEMFGLQAIVCRLGNVVGGGMQRGIVFDFINKLMDASDVLHVLGNGQQRKSYVLVDDVLAAVNWLRGHLDDSGRVHIFNVSAGGSLGVAGVAAAVARAMEHPVPRLISATSSLSWQGDQPVVELDISRLLDLGWRPSHAVEEAMEAAARLLLPEVAKRRRGPS